MEKEDALPSICFAKVSLTHSAGWGRAGRGGEALARGWVGCVVRWLVFFFSSLNLMQMSSLSWHSQALLPRSQLAAPAHPAWQHGAGQQLLWGQGIRALCHPPPYLFLLSVAHSPWHTLVFVALPPSSLRCTGAVCV